MATPSDDVPVIQLNAKQQQALDFVKEGHNTFITGSAGVGKSILIDRIKEWAAETGKGVAVTATTGIAASNINGSTIYSWGSIRLGKGEPGKFAYYIKKDETKLSRYLDTDILVIDEVSMADFEYFMTLNLVAQIVRGARGVPFGGIQIVVCGDFFQLGPVQKDRKKTKFIFEDRVWADMVTKTVHLTQVYRQKNSDFIDMLHKIRVGDVSDDIVSRIKATEQHKLKNEHGIKPTVLFCRNVDVDALNDAGLRQLDGEEFEYKSNTFFENDDYKRLYEKSFTVLDELTLKVGAQVMLIQNLSVEGGLVNGSRGVVTEIIPKGNDEFPTGGVMVEFMNGVKRMLQPFKQVFKDDNASIDGPERAYRIQYPLKLAYALTIHKSQGLSIDFLEIDLRGCFAAGQAYVALSRATSFETLRAKNFSKRSVITSETVKAYYENVDKNGPKRKHEGPIEKLFSKRTKVEL